MSDGTGHDSKRKEERRHGRHRKHDAVIPPEGNMETAGSAPAMFEEPVGQRINGAFVMNPEPADPEDLAQRLKPGAFMNSAETPQQAHDIVTQASSPLDTLGIEDGLEDGQGFTGKIRADYSRRGAIAREKIDGADESNPAYYDKPTVGLEEEGLHRIVRVTRSGNLHGEKKGR